PNGEMGRLPANIPLETTSCGGSFEAADISLRSGLQVCSPPRSSLPLRILPQGSRGFYVRAERGSLPPRASDMLTARRQAIGGARTCPPLACGLIGCSSPYLPLPSAGEALPPPLDTALLIRAPEGLEPSRSGRCPAHTMPSADFCSAVRPPYDDLSP